MIRSQAFRDLPIRRKLTWVVLPISAVGLLLALVTVGWLSASSLRRQTEDQTRSLAVVVGDNTAGALSFSDAENASRTLNGLAAIPSVALACLYQRDAEGGAGRQLAAFRRPGEAVCPAEPPAVAVSMGGRLRVLQPVRVAEEEIGLLLLERDLSELHQQIRLELLGSASIFLLVLILVALLLRLAAPRIVAPIQELAATAARIRVHRDYGLRASQHGQDEVGELVDSFNAMLDEIQRTQGQLVQSEKMAALAGLVAGVAHEVNTPVGIGVTGISHLRQELGKVRAGLAEGTLGRNALQRFLDLCEESTQLVMTHLERAAALVASFKQVAVDQTADDRREFELAAYLRELALSLTPMFKNSPYQLRLSADGELPLDSYPGAIAQIVTNLVINALLHGLEGRARGEVLVSAQAVDTDQICLRISDDGRGIPAQHQASLFQPFFTTRRGAGGTGLGLHLVYNLVTQRLRGRIEFQTTEGQGTVFVIHFPRRVNAP